MQLAAALYHEPVRRAIIPSSPAKSDPPEDAAMWQTVIGREIRRTTRNLFWTNALILGALIAAVAATAGYWYNFALGPFDLAREDLRALTSADGLTKNFVRVEGTAIDE